MAMATAAVATRRQRGSAEARSASAGRCGSWPTSWSWTKSRWRSWRGSSTISKTERAQGEVDCRRSLSGFADAVAGPTFDATRAKESAALRVATAERLRDAVTAALGRLHALLDNDQRERLAYLIRTGVLSL